MRYNRNNQGYTLVELMVATVVGMVLIAGATTTFIVQNRSYQSTESVSELNSQSKTSLNIIAEDIRNAGGGTPSDLGANPINGQTSVIVVSDRDGGNSAPDSITLVGGFRVIGNIAAEPSSSPPVTVNGNKIWIANAEDKIDTDDRMNINIDGMFFARITGCTNTAGECNSPTTGIFLNTPLIIDDLPVGRPVYLIEAITYCLSGTDLRRIRRNVNLTFCTGGVDSDTELIAQNVADLQFAYAVDADNDGDVDIGSGNAAILDDADFIDGSAVLNPDDIRAVRISVLGIASREDRGVTTGNPPLSIENRMYAPAPTGDGFKRRLWQTIVTIQSM